MCFYCPFSQETPDGCGTDMGCFGNCDDPQNCKFVVTWSDNEESVDFTISMDTEGSSNQWIALGLSEDQTMVTLYFVL